MPFFDIVWSGIGLRFIIANATNTVTLSSLLVFTLVKLLAFLLIVATIFWFLFSVELTITVVYIYPASIYV